MKLAMNSEKNLLPNGANASGNVQKIFADEVELGGIDRIPCPSYWSIAEM